MKINKLLMLISLSFLIINCEDISIKEKNDTTISAVSFIKKLDKFIVTSANENTYQLKIGTTKPFNTDKTFEIILNSDESTVNSFEYELEATNITIPAGKLNGYTNITFDFETLVSGAVANLVFDLITSEETIQNVSLQRTTITYSRPCNFNLITLDITFDNYSEETSWDIKNEGTIIFSSSYVEGITETSELICLQSGNYTFTIYDAYNDGICCAFGDGSYTLFDDNNTYVSGATFAQSETSSFTID